MLGFRILGYATLRALASIRRRPLIAALTVGVMTIALALVGVTYLVEHNMRRLSDEWGSGVQMIVYLDEGTTSQHAEKLLEALVALPAVESVDYIPSERAMAHLQTSLGQHDELIEGIEPSFLPASLEVRLIEGVRDLVSAHPVIERLEQTPGVEEVEFLGDWVDNFTALLAKLQSFGLWMVAIASVIGIFTVVATMRLSADARTSELRVLLLMGAPSLLRRGPNLIEGALLGALGALISIGTLYAIFSKGAPVIAESLQLSFGQVDFHFLNLRDLLQLTVFGISLGVVGGMVTNHSQART